MPSNRLLIRTKTAVVTSILLCFLTALIVALAPAPAQAATGEYTDEQGVKYTYTSYGPGAPNVTVTGIYSDQLTNVVVPAYITIRDTDPDPDLFRSLTVTNVNLSGDMGTITSLDMTKCTGIALFTCTSSKLVSVDLSGCQFLTRLDCSDSQLGNLQVSGCGLLSSIDC